MSTVTKPVMLNETGQQIKGTLEEIRDAITGSGSTHYPVSIRISTPPEKVDYIVGEQLDLTGIAVQAIYDNGVPYDVTGDTTFSPSDGTVLSASDTTITATWTWTLGQQTQTFTATRAINVSTVESIEVTTPPTKTEYTQGETLDLTGMVVKANMSNNTQIDVTAQCSYSPANGATLSAANTSVTATLTTSGSTFTATQAITVSIPTYGISWDGSASPVCVRTDDATSFVDPVPYSPSMSGSPSSPMDSIAPWSGMREVTDAEAGKLIEIPKFYYKWETSGNSVSVKVSPIAKTGYMISPAHQDRGDGVGERDYVYVGKYLCGSDYKSKTGETVGYDHTDTIENWRTHIGALGTNVWLWDYLMLNTLWILYSAEFANWNSQLIGRGGYVSSRNFTSGVLDSINYHTGKNSDELVKYRGIETPWGKFDTVVDGLTYYTQYGEYQSLYLKKNPADNSTTTNDGEEILKHTVDSNIISNKLITKIDHPIVNGSAENVLIVTAAVAQAYTNEYFGDGGANGYNVSGFNGWRSGGFAIDGDSSNDSGNTYKWMGIFHIASRGSVDGTTGCARLMKLPPSRLA